ncbi:putative HECT-type ubiquitin ligase-interacting protein cred [Rhypophila sp. PSN 637]
MPSFPKFSFSSAVSFFDIRLDNDFIVFRGSEHESSGQLLRGTVVLCTKSPFKVENISLSLTGCLRLCWDDQRINSTGLTHRKIDRTTNVHTFTWPSLIDLPVRGSPSIHSTSNSTNHPRSTTLEAGNYEYPFELEIPGTWTESIEGLPQAKFSYKLKATIFRGRLSHDLHAEKRFRVIRTLNPAALEVLHAMSVENIWPNKVEYSITVPQKAIVFGTSIPLETRFTPLLKGLEMGDVTVKLVESQDIILQSGQGHNLREFRKEKEVNSWTIPMNRDEHWQEMIEDTGQEGWVMKSSLNLPQKLGQCIQDVNAQGIKIRHKLKIVVALKNPDGHISELRATLPVSIFISPNMPLDEQGKLVRQVPLGVSASQAAAVNAVAPPGYMEHHLDQLYDEVDVTGLQTPAPRSGASTPTFGHSRAGSSDNLQALGHGITPAALQYRLQGVSLERSRRNQSYNSLGELTPAATGTNSAASTPRLADAAHISPPPTAPLTRQHSAGSSSDDNNPEHIDFPEMYKLPSYKTAVKTPANILPDYFTAISAPNSRANSPPGSPQPLPSELPARRLSQATQGRFHSFDSVARPIRLKPSTLASNLSDDAVPDTDPSSAAGLLAERLSAWKHAVSYLEEYMEAVEKIHRAQAKEYERALKAISRPLKEGHHFDQSLGGVAGLFENMRVNTQALINTNAETEKNIKGSVLPVIERLHKEIKHKAKELAHGAQKGAKDVEKARNTTQKHIELLGQHTASFESAGGKMSPHDDPYVLKRGVLHRLNHQVMEENNHRNDLIAVQNNFQAFETHVITVIQQAMEAFNSFCGGQAEKVRALHSDMLGAAQRIPHDFEWKAFIQRSRSILVDPSEDPRTVDSITFPNMEHPSTKPLVEGSLERKSRNKLSWGYQTGYYVVTPSKFIHEFKDSDNFRKDPVPELSIYLPDAIIGAPNGEKFNIKGKDRSKTMSSKLTGHSELAFKAHSPAEAQKWFDIIRNVTGATGPMEPMSPTSPTGSSGPTTPIVAGDEKKLEAAPAGNGSGTSTAADHKAQEAGVVTGGEVVASPVAASPSDAKTPASAPVAAADTKAPVIAEPVAPATAVSAETAKETKV